MINHERATDKIVSFTLLKMINPSKVKTYMNITREIMRPIPLTEH